MKIGNSRREYGQMPRKEWRTGQDEDDMDLDDLPEEVPAENKYEFTSTVAGRRDSPLDEPAQAEECSSVIGAGSTWNGTFTTEGSVRLDGTISGEVKASGTVYIGEGANVNATVQGKYIVVAGNFDGQMYCSDRVVLQPSSKVRGSITTRLFSVGEGAFIDGEVRMVDELPATLPVSAPAAARNGNGNGSETRPLFREAEPISGEEEPLEAKRNGAGKTRA